MTVVEGRLYSGMSAADRATERRRRLLDAGLEVFGTGGPATARAVIRASGLAPRYLYDAFSGIDDLQTTLFNELLSEAERLGVLAVTGAAGDPRARVRAVVKAMVGFLLDDPRHGRFLLIESLGSPVLGPLRQTAVRRFADTMADYTLDLAGRRRASSPRVRLNSLFLLGGFIETVTAALDADGFINRDRLVDELTQLFLSAMKG